MIPTMIAPAIVIDRIPQHERADGQAWRVLDPTEHNMERLNARARGSARTYHTLVVEGPLSRGSFERAVDLLVTRHPTMRVRIVRDDEGRLAYAPTHGERPDGTARVPINYVTANDLTAWPALVEADMNAGAIASERGPLFAFAVLSPPGLADGANGRRVIVMVGHHGVCDAVSAVAVLHELLQDLASLGPHAGPDARGPWPAADVYSDGPLVNPFCLDVPAPPLPEIESRVRGLLAAGGARDAHGGAELAALRGRLDTLEQQLVAQKDGAGRYPAALATVHGLISALDAELRPARGLTAEVALGADAARYQRARTALVPRSLDAEVTAALRRAAKEHALTMHGVLSAAMLVALAAEPGASAAPRPERLALASAVNLRPQLVPPLSPSDLRMAVDIVFSRIAVEPGARFWELARRAGDDVTRAVASGRALSSYFRTVRRDLGDTPPGVAIPLLSNLGRADLATSYGPFRVRDLSASMTTHGSFQLALFCGTFDGRLSMSFYCETPTVSRAALERLAERFVNTLTIAAGGRGEEP